MRFAPANSDNAVIRPSPLGPLTGVGATGQSLHYFQAREGTEPSQATAAWAPSVGPVIWPSNVGTAVTVTGSAHGGQEPVAPLQLNSMEPCVTPAVGS